MTDNIRAQIETLLAAAREAIPSSVIPDLPPGKYTSGQPDFHAFEWKIWDLGEQIRQLVLDKVSLRKDESLQRDLVKICTNRRAKRGRQSFIMLLGYKSCQEHAAAVATQIDDPGVCGHVIATLLKMRAAGFAEAVRPFVEYEKSWIRNKAKTYCRRYGQVE